MEKHEILAALQAGQVVHWNNTGYLVTIDSLDSNNLLVTFKHNEYCNRLQVNDYEDCFIANEKY